MVLDDLGSGPTALHNVALAQLVPSACFDPPIDEHEARRDKLLGLAPRGGQAGQFDELAQGYRQLDRNRHWRLRCRPGIGRRCHPSRST